MQALSNFVWACSLTPSITNVHVQVQLKMSGKCAGDLSPMHYKISQLNRFTIAGIEVLHENFSPVALLLISRNFDHKCSELCCKVQKFVMRFTNQFTNYTSNWLLLLQGPIRDRDFVYKLACKFRYGFPNLEQTCELCVVKFRTFVVNVL